MSKPPLSKGTECISSATPLEEKEKRSADFLMAQCDLDMIESHGSQELMSTQNKVR